MAKQIQTATADILISAEGSVYLFSWGSEPGKDFLTQEVETEPWQWLGSNLVVDHRYGVGLAEYAQANGLTLGNLR
jgi:hypothetical protein